MPLDISKIEAVIFDYGNTLIELGSEQVLVLNNSLHKLVLSMFGPCDFDKFSAVRRGQILAPYNTDEFIENDKKGICRELIEELYGETPTSDQIEKMVELKRRGFVDIIKCPEFVLPLLDRLKKRYRLAFISNYPCSESISESLAKNGLDKIFESVVVSGDVGRVKPHSELFHRSTEDLQLPSERCLYIGDNWLADIQGAKRAGMQAVHTTQYVSYEKFEPYDGDFMPDAVIEHLQELDRLLLDLA